MASNEKFVAFIRDQMAGAGCISTRKLFGEFAIYRDETVVALVCDDQLFEKPTAAGRPKNPRHRHGDRSSGLNGVPAC